VFRRAVGHGCSGIWRIYGFACYPGTASSGAELDEWKRSYESHEGFATLCGLDFVTQVSILLCARKVKLGSRGSGREDSNQ
jgi:hypothetical protein